MKDQKDQKAFNLILKESEKSGITKKRANFRHLGSSGTGRLDKISIKYKNDLNLIELSNRIIHFLEDEKTSIVPQLDKEIATLEVKISKPQFANARRLDLKALENHKKKKEEILSGVKKDKFIQMTIGLLKKYSELGVLEAKAVFGIDETTTTEDPEKAKLRDILISQFLNIARSFVPLEVEKKYTPKYICIGCQYNLEESIGPEDSSEVTCPNCGMLAQIFKQYTSGVGVNSENSDYEDRENFIKAKERYQGRQNVIFPDKFYSDLDAFFISRGLPTGEEVRKMEKNRGRRGPPGLVGKKILRKALAAKAYNHHYDDINLIAHEYWDFDLPDISQLDDILESDYDKTEKVFKQIKGPERKATINTQWRLQAHLLARGYKVEDDDFKTIETPSIVEQYRKWWRVMLEKCGDPSLKYVEF